MRGGAPESPARYVLPLAPPHAAATPANVTIASGDGSPGVTFEVAAGLHQVQAPALPGSQRFVVSRGGAVLVDVTGGERVNASEAVTDLCNAQTYTGSAWLSGAAERG